MPSKYQNFKIKSNIERKRREKEEDKRGKPGIRRQHHFSAHSLFCSPSRTTPLIDVLLFRSVGLVFQRLSAEIILAGEKGRGEEEGRSDEREEKKGVPPRPALLFVFPFLSRPLVLSPSVVFPSLVSLASLFLALLLGLHYK